MIISFSLYLNCLSSKCKNLDKDLLSTPFFECLVYICISRVMEYFQGRTYSVKEDNRSVKYVQSSSYFCTYDSSIFVHGLS